MPCLQIQFRIPETGIRFPIPRPASPVRLPSLPAPDSLTPHLCIWCLIRSCGIYRIQHQPPPHNPTSLVSPVRFPNPVPMFNAPPPRRTRTAHATGWLPGQGVRGKESLSGHRQHGTPPATHTAQRRLSHIKKNPYTTRETTIRFLPRSRLFSPIACSCTQREKPPFSLATYIASLCTQREKLHFSTLGSCLPFRACHSMLPTHPWLVLPCPPCVRALGSPLTFCDTL